MNEDGESLVFFSSAVLSDGSENRESHPLVLVIPMLAEPSDGICQGLARSGLG